MAIPTNIKTLLSGEAVEWARIEFKETWDAAASLKTICAFANDLDNWGGGYIVIGVEEEDGRPVYPLKGVPVEKLNKYQESIIFVGLILSCYSFSKPSASLDRNLIQCIWKSTRRRNI